MSCGKMRSRGRVKRQIKMPRVKKPARAMSGEPAVRCKMRWFSKGDCALRRGENKTEKGLIRDILHLQWSTVKEGLSDGLEGVGM